MAYRLLRNNCSEGKDKEITGVTLNINAIEMCTDIPECKPAKEIWHVTQADDHLNTLTAYVINLWPSVRIKVKEEIQPY